MFAFLFYPYIGNIEFNNVILIAYLIKINRYLEKIVWKKSECKVKSLPYFSSINSDLEVKIFSKMFENVKNVK